MECIFCKIINKEIPAKISYADENILIFDDIKPQAPIHKLIIPKRHISTANDLQQQDAQLIGQMILAAKNMAHSLDIAEEGYRLVLNCNAGGGQEVFHLHLHLLGARRMQWPPG